MKPCDSPELVNELREVTSQDNIARFSMLMPELESRGLSSATSQLLLEVLGDAEDRLWLWVTGLSCDENPYARRYATAILLRLWDNDKGRAEEVLTSLADYGHWLVREYAHEMWGELLKRHFEQVSSLMRNLNSHPYQSSEDVS
ncbi:MAG: hypothetical protein QW087_02535 [Methanomassiliicoccales archaeon]